MSHIKRCEHFTDSPETPEVIAHWKIAGYCRDKKSNISAGVCDKCQKNPINTVNKPKPKKLLGY